MKFDGLRRDLQPLIPSRMVIEFGVGDPPDDLFPEEAAATSEWTLHRRSQFALGRSCARRALARLEVTAAPILFDSEGAPIWPHGIVGSISHKRLNCVVAAGPSDRIGGVGVDLEFDELEPHEDEIIDRVCIPSERLQVAALRSSCRSPGTLFLAAKEAFFKMQYPISRASLDWDEVEVTFQGSRVFVRGEPSSLAASTQGCFLASNGWILVLVYTFSDATSGT